MKAFWNDQLLAESDETIVIEGNHYFPPGAIKSEFFGKSETQSRCPWKGTANYYSLNVAGQENKDAAWYYPEVSTQAKGIKGYVAFWKGVKVEK
jgi:uncharacterized protein (DUF427 family)